MYERHEKEHQFFNKDVQDRPKGDTAWGPGRHGPGNNLFVFYTYPDGDWIEISGELETIYDRETID